MNNEQYTHEDEVCLDGSQQQNIYSVFIYLQCKFAKMTQLVLPHLSISSYVKTHESLDEL